MGLVPGKVDTRELALSPRCDDAVRKQPPTSLKDSCPQKAACVHPGPTSLQNGEKINVCYEAAHLWYFAMADPAN